MRKCDVCGRKDRMCGVGSGYSGSPAITISWCARPKCIAEARARRVAADKRPRLHFVSKTSDAIGALALPKIHILDPQTKTRSICGVLLSGETREFHESVFTSAYRGCRSCDRMRASAEERLPRSPAPATSALSNRQARGALSNSPSSPAPATSTKNLALEGFRIDHDGAITLQQKRIRCGKRRCRKLHGPYWYAFFKVDGRTRCRYIGRELPVALEREPRCTINGLRSIGPYRVRACCGAQPEAPHFKGCEEASP